MSKELMDAVLNGDNILLTGGAGVGKTFKSNQIITVLREMKRKFAVTAMTGLASQHLDFGMTIHSFLKLGGYTSVSDFKHISADAGDYYLTLDEVSTILIDEVSMMRPDFFELLDVALKYVRTINNRKNKRLMDPREQMPFGGFQLIFVGDFLQLPPVIDRKEELMWQWIFQHPLFKQARFKIFNLTQIMRTGNPLLATAYNKLRVGYVDNEVRDMFKSRVGAPLEKEGTRLYSLVKLTDAFNSERLKSLDGLEVSVCSKTYYAKKYQNDFCYQFGLDEETARKKRQFLYRQILKEAALPETIDMKIGCRIMIKANNATMGYMNGSQGILLDVKEIDNLSLVFTNNQGIDIDLDHTYIGECLHVLLDDGYDVLVKRKEFKIVSDAYNPETGTREADIKYLQFPVSLGYAITMHKSQGMSLSYMTLDPNRIFADNQFYVGISRGRTLEGISLTSWDERVIRANQAAINFYLRIGDKPQGWVYE